MKVSNIELTFQNFTKGGPAILTGFKPAFNYRDGQRVDTEIVGRKATVVFPANSYDTLVVTVSNPVDAISPILAKATAENPVYVDFDGFQARIYVMNGNAGVSAKASAIRIVSTPVDIDDEIIMD